MMSDERQRGQDDVLQVVAVILWIMAISACYERGELPWIQGVGVGVGVTVAEEGRR